MKTLCILFNFIFLASNCFAGEMLARQQQMKKELIKKQALQERTLQQQQPPIAQEPIRRRGQMTTISPQSRTSASRYGYEEEIVDIEELWFELETSSQVWGRILDYRPKEATVEMYIDWYAENEIYIKKPASEYVSIIDNMVAQNPTILSNPFRDVLKVVAIIEYDFENGQNKDVMARKVLGEKAYQANKQRLGK